MKPPLCGLNPGVRPPAGQGEHMRPGGSSPGARQAGLEPDSGLRHGEGRMDSEAISEIG